MWETRVRLEWETIYFGVGGYCRFDVIDIPSNEFQRSSPNSRMTIHLQEAGILGN